MKKTLIAAIITISSLSGCAYNAEQFNAADKSSDYAEAKCQTIYKDGTFPYTERVMSVTMLKVNPNGSLYYQIKNDARSGAKFAHGHKPFIGVSLFEDLQCEDTTLYHWAKEKMSEKGITEDDMKKHKIPTVIIQAS